MSDRDDAAEGADASDPNESVSNAVADYELVESAEIEVRAAFWFFREIPPDFRLPQPDRKLYTTADQNTREKIQNEMNAFLANEWTAEELFPDSTSAFVLAIPRRYTRVRADDINRMFPKADLSARNLLDRYVEVFTHNFYVRLAFRRLAQVVSSFAILLFGYLLVKLQSENGVPSWLTGSLDGWLWPVLGYAAGYLVGWLVYLILSWIIAAFGTLPRERSAQAVSQNMLERLQAIGNCLNEIAVAERDFFDKQESVWVAESNYFTSLLIWLPMRAYHLENYFQIKMARIRTAMWFGQLAALLIAIFLFWAILTVTQDLDAQKWYVGDEGRTVFAVAIGVFAFHSALVGGTRLDAIRRLVTVDKWQTLGRIQMHTQIADVVGFLIKKFIMLRDAGRDTRY